jgi:hypothetical protein
MLDKDLKNLGKRTQSIDFFIIQKDATATKE